MIEGLGCLWLDVADLDRSVAFYRDGLRFSFDGGNHGGQLANLRAGDLRVVLNQADEEPCRGRGVAFTVEVSGVDAYHDALVARGLEPSPPRDEGSVRAFVVADPDGYEWRFIQSLA